jgi:3-isopropylmalate/(R)-2-methylmalate dehydratase small subunit
MIRGRVVLKLGDDISTDLIYPGRFMATVLPSETPQFAFADHAAFQRKLKAGEIPAGSVVVAGNNFGCGSSREQAASCLRGHELAVIARGFARIFLQNAINLGLGMVICPTLEAEEGDELEVRGETIFDCTTARSFPILPLPRARQAIIDAGGLVPYTRRLLMEQEGAKTG